MDQVVANWIAHLVLAIPAGPHGINFDANLADGTIVNRTGESQRTVSLRHGGSHAYVNPAVVARVIVAGEHDHTQLMGSPPRRLGP